MPKGQITIEQRGEISRKRFEGKVYNKWTVQKYLYAVEVKLNVRHYYFRCLCECGTVVDRDIKNISGKISKSCGCNTVSASIERFSKYPIEFNYKSKEHRAWMSMKTRCYNTKFINYHRWGGRGISVCDRWLGEGGFMNFIQDIGKAPSKKHTLDRIDNDKDYTPQNCKWSTYKEQLNNTSRNLLIDYNGDKKSISKISEILGIKEDTLRGRYFAGMRGDSLFSITNHSNKKKLDLSKPKKFLVIDYNTGIFYESVKELSFISGVNVETLYRWLNGKSTNKSKFKYV